MPRNAIHRHLTDFLTGIRTIQAALQNCDSVLDIGCGRSNTIQRVIPDGTQTMGIDLHEPSIEQARSNGHHNEYRVLNALDIDSEFGKDAFAAVVSFDLVEHLTKEDSSRLLDKMEIVARDYIVVVTPNGFIPQSEEPDNPYQRHHCGWVPEEMVDRGYTVYGIMGLKSLRGAYATLRWKPKFFWYGVSLFTQLWVKSRPNSAFHMLAVKHLQ